MLEIVCRNHQTARISIMSTLIMKQRWSGSRMFSTENEDNVTTTLIGDAERSENVINTLIIQPNPKNVKLLQHMTNTKEQAVEEARGLVDSVPNWKAQAVMFANLRKPTSYHHLFSEGVFQDLTHHIRKLPNMDTVLVNWPSLSGLQLSTLQHAWQRPVLDRYSLVLEIFKQHAHGKEARLQVQLAELDYLRSRVNELYTTERVRRISAVEARRRVLLATQGKEKDAWQMNLVTCHSQEERRNFIDTMYNKVWNELHEMEARDDATKRRHRARHWPLVSVVGYTNAGKTSLVRRFAASSGSSSRLCPDPRLFATLDVSSHLCRLCTHFTVMLSDTVGFLADLPNGLVSAFRATLRDCLDTDLVLVLVDVSDPNYETQLRTVQSTLSQVLPEGVIAPPEDPHPHRYPVPEERKRLQQINKRKSHLEEAALTCPEVLWIATKVDRLSDLRRRVMREMYPQMLQVSCTTGEGLAELEQRMKETLVEFLGYERRHIRVAQGGAVYSWMLREAVIEKVAECHENGDMLLVDALFSPSQLVQFVNQFHRKDPAKG